VVLLVSELRGKKKWEGAYETFEGGRRNRPRKGDRLVFGGKKRPLISRLKREGTPRGNHQVSKEKGGSFSYH